MTLNDMIVEIPGESEIEMIVDIPDSILVSEPEELIKEEKPNLPEMESTIEVPADIVWSAETVQRLQTSIDMLNNRADIITYTMLFALGVGVAVLVCKLFYSFLRDCMTY